MSLIPTGAEPCRIRPQDLGIASEATSQGLALQARREICTAELPYLRRTSHKIPDM